jgi:2,4-dienoyl-CoA reductase-like NADH-dependent reductase (Old Yellow Enzyme family)
MAPIATEKSDAGKVTRALLDYYDERTKGGYPGLIVIEHSFIRSDGRAGVNQLSVSEDSDIAGLSRLADTIHKNESKAVMQISHAGAAARKEAVPFETISPSGIANPNKALRPGELQDTHEMSRNEIDGVIQAFTEAAIRVKKAGFDGVELHSAHGYLLNQFYSPLTNKRTDEYCGSTVDGRIALHIRIIQAVRATVGADFPLGMRLGGCDYTVGGSTVADAAAAAPKLVAAGLDFMDMSGGMCFYIRAGHSEAGYFGDLSKSVKDVVSVPVIVAGGVTNGADAEKLLTENIADMIAVGRAISRNPAWAKEAMEA